MMAIRLRRRLRSVRKKSSKVRLMDSPSRGPAIRPAKKVPVPGVESVANAEKNKPRIPVGVPISPTPATGEPTVVPAAEQNPPNGK